MKVKCSVLRRNVLSVVMLTMESADRALMPASVMVRVDTWSKTIHRIEVRLKVMLSLVLTRRVKQQSNLPRGTDSMP